MCIPILHRMNIGPVAFQTDLDDLITGEGGTHPCKNCEQYIKNYNYILPALCLQPIDLSALSYISLNDFSLFILS